MLIVTKVLVASGVVALAVAGPTPADGTRDGQAVAANTAAAPNPAALHCIDGCNIWRLMVSRSP